MGARRLFLENGLIADMKDVLHKLYKKDGSFLALWEYGKAQDKGRNPVFLNHGTYSNRSTLVGIVEYLVEKGCHCWVLEWPEHGASSKTDVPYDFETIGRNDFKQAIDYVLNITCCNQADIVAHSGGGICSVIFLIYHRLYREKIGRMCFLATQSYAAVQGPISRFKIWLGKIMMLARGKSDGKFTGSPHDEKVPLMGQWFQWNLNRVFTGENGLDFIPLMNDIKNPVLLLAGEGDTFIAPYKACKSFYDNLGGGENKIIHCGTSTGYLENYTHGRIVLSSSARKEIYPMIGDWISR